MDAIILLQDMSLGICLERILYCNLECKVENLMLLIDNFIHFKKNGINVINIKDVWKNWLLNFMVMTLLFWSILSTQILVVEVMDRKSIMLFSPYGLTVLKTFWKNIEKHWNQIMCRKILTIGSIWYTDTNNKVKKL